MTTGLLTLPTEKSQPITDIRDLTTLLYGLPGIGKTTWAANFASSDDDHWVNINRDDLRAMIYESMRPTQKFSWQKWRWSWEDDVTAAQLEKINLAVEHKHNIIISDTNLNQKIRDRMIALLESVGYEVELKFFEVTLEEAIRRDAARPNSVGADVITKQFKQWAEILDLSRHKFL